MAPTLESLNAYLREVFDARDDQLSTLMERAVAGGLPDISITPDVGRLLTLLVSMTRGERAIEVGTLAGQSAIWLARGLAPAGRLYTIELVEEHADFAQTEIDSAGLSERVEIRRGAAIEVLQGLREELGTSSIDAIFLDAVKVEYPRYLEILKPMLRVGGLLLADNALGGGEWWITDPPGNASRDTIDAFNRAIVDDPQFQTACIANREGLLVARKVA